MAQLVEQRIRNAWVAGSSPAIGSPGGFDSRIPLSPHSFYLSLKASPTLI